MKQPETKLPLRGLGGLKQPETKLSALNIAHIEPRSQIYAPNTHFVIWVQGCAIRCAGCWNERMWDFTRKNLIAVEDLFRQIQTVSSSIQGVAFLGGEPLDQALPLLALVKQIKAIGLGVTIYTGYELAELEAPKYQAVLAYTDLLIAGRYDEKQRNINLRWRGSENQQILWLSAFYSDSQPEEANYCEIKIDQNGKITILGFPTEELLGIIGNEL
jgi:anaerobic ribonucleoside-triphosphate reductase activating protein